MMTKVPKPNRLTKVKVMTIVVSSPNILLEVRVMMFNIQSKYLNHH